MDVKNFDTAGALKRSFSRLEELLEANYKKLNRLNVFPVPDGDTGTNMLLTVRSVNDALRKVQGQAGEAANFAKTVSMAALLGARGNSGVILSQMIQGFVSHLSTSVAHVRDSSELISSWAEALQEASDEARSAVLKPMEGTILTVASSAAKQALMASKTAGVDLESVIRSTLERARITLAETPNMLEQLKKAGVVDSGGAGFVHVLEALYEGFLGKELPESLKNHPWLEDSADFTEIQSDNSYAQSSKSQRGPRYEIMYLLEAETPDVEDMKNKWAEIGDSIVVVGSDGMHSCHIHSDDIGASIEAGIVAGKVSNIRVSDLYDLIAEGKLHKDDESLHSLVNEAKETDVFEPAEYDQEVTEAAMVAVVNGVGLGETLRSIGVSGLVDGGDSMNPSTQEIVKIVESVAARSVVLFPNNKNVLATARLAQDLASKPVEVIPTASVLQAFSLALDFDPSKNASDNAALMREQMPKVRYGEITFASRSGVTRDGTGSFVEGDLVGIYHSDVEVAGKDLSEVVISLCEKMMIATDELITLVWGSQLTLEQATDVTKVLREKMSHLDVDLLYGGQPNYPLLISIE